MAREVIEIRPGSGGRRWRPWIPCQQLLPRHRRRRALYDSRRGVWYVKPALRGWLHLLWFEASLVLGTLLVARAHGAVRITALAIYAASVSAMFGISALYHRGNWSAAWNRRLQRLDHAMICAAAACQYVAIALFLTSRG